MGEIEAVWRFLEPSKGEHGRMVEGTTKRTCHVPPSPLPKDHLSYARASLRPRIPSIPLGAENIHSPLSEVSYITPSVPDALD